MKISLEPQRISLLTLEFCIGQYSREVGVTVMKKRSLTQHEFRGWRVGFSSQDVHTLFRFPGAWEWQLLSRHPWLWWPLVALVEKAGLQWDEMFPLALWSVPPYLWCCCCCCDLLVQPFLPSHSAAIPCHNHCFPWKSCLCLFTRPGWKPGCGKSWYLLCLELCLLMFLGFEGQGKEKSAFTSQQPTMCRSDPHPLLEKHNTFLSGIFTSDSSRLRESWKFLNLSPWTRRLLPYHSSLLHNGI